jgi:diguanylate cyclase (GGDEF)-like protein/PAS domain S-box-containing protein
MSVATPTKGKFARAATDRIWKGLYLLPVVTFLASIAISRAIESHDRDHMSHEIEQRAESVSAAIQALIKSDADALQRMASRWEFSGKPSRAAWEDDARNYYQHSKRYQAIEWVSPKMRVEWLVPYEGNEKALNLNLTGEPRRAKAILMARDQRKITVSRPISLVQGGKGFLIYIPIYRKDQFEGLIVGVYRIDSVLKSLSPMITDQLTITVSEGGNEVVTWGRATPAWQAMWGQTAKVELPGEVQWTVRATPTSQSLTRHQSNLPLFVVVTGGIVSAGIFWLIAAYSKSNRATQRAAISETRFRSAIQSMHDGLVLQNHRGAIEIANNRACEILGLTHDEIRGRTSVDPRWRTFTEGGDPWPGETHPSMVALREGREIVGKVMAIQRHTGETAWIRIHSTPIHDPKSGEIVQVVSTFADITQSKKDSEMIQSQLVELTHLNKLLKERQRRLTQTNRELEVLASVDTLTQVSNRRAFMERLQLEVHACRPPDDSLSVILLDVDDFKQYNDDFGHPAGDQVLSEIGRILLGNTRPSDLVARIGGEEFAVILPNTPLSAASQLAERLREAIENENWNHRKVTASFGVSTMVNAIQSSEALLEIADAQLYESKRNGRNQVSVTSCGPL